ncbi:uncharacterized protein LOC141602097 [Silene latifolia]|uniref:uncharacterized protein LOC141602097 n=1 Tax=Silene latifolia TaxID=37657 RepID=UPI003D76E988
MPAAAVTEAGEKKDSTGPLSKKVKTDQPSPPVLLTERQLEKQPVQTGDKNVTADSSSQKASCVQLREDGVKLAKRLVKWAEAAGTRQFYEAKSFGEKAPNFRQLPVVSKGSRADVVHASLCSSYLWSSCKVLTLTKNIRLQAGSEDTNVDEIRKFLEWILKIGDGLVGDPNDERAIRAPTHEIVEDVNDYVLSLIHEEERIYLSSDEVSRDDRTIGDPDLYSTEFLNSIKCSGLPNHELRLKVGAMVMLLRNIDQSHGLCNGTRLIVTDLGRRVISCTVLTGSHKGDRVHIARITLTPSDFSKFPVRFSRRQFPIAVCFAMTINKSQGQSLSQVSIYLPRPVFNYGQLYVAIWRVTSKQGLKLLICDSNKRTSNITTNVVYQEIFEYL